MRRPHQRKLVTKPKSVIVADVSKHKRNHKLGLHRERVRSKIKLNLAFS